MSAQLQPAFDHRHPDYVAEFRRRGELLSRFRRATPQQQAAMLAFYRDRPARFIGDFGQAHDPRNPERGLPSTVAFIPFERQVELIEFVMGCWREQRNGIVEKSRDCGASTLSMALAVTLCLLNKGITIGVGSRKEQLIDNGGDPSSLFAKARMFHEGLPSEFRGTMASAHMRLIFPSTNSSIIGEAGDQIGRGARTSLYFIDEAAFLESPESVDGALSATTNCRIDISTPNGRANSFAEKRFGGKIPVFTFHWRSDKRKDDAWYAKQCAQLDPVTVARELDLDYSGSVVNQLIPAAWVQSAMGAHLKLGIELSTTGLARWGALDVADQGKDLNAFCGRNGVVVEHIHSWSGKSSDIYETVVKAATHCDSYGYPWLAYDADGLGAGVRGDIRRLNEDREKAALAMIRDEPFRGSGPVYNPDSSMVKGRLNKDMFANRKAQAWWHLRILFQNTHRAIAEGLPWEADKVISLAPGLEELTALMLEVSQPTFSINSVGKILVDKAPDGCRSPNLADALMIAMAPGTNRFEMYARLGAVA